MRTEAFGEESLFSGGLIPPSGLLAKWCFFFCNMSACLKCTEPRLLCFISRAVTNSSEILGVCLRVENGQYSSSDTTFIYKLVENKYSGSGKLFRANHASLFYI